MKEVLSIFTVVLITTVLFIYKDNIVRSSNIINYDMYILELKWGPNECLSYPTPARIICLKYLAKAPKNILLIDEFSPALQKTGQEIENCNPGTQIIIKDEFTILMNKMKKYWVNLDPSSTNFIEWIKEYNEHGYCYSQKYKQTDYRLYFQQALEVYEKLNLESLLVQLFGGEKRLLAVPYPNLVGLLNSRLGQKKYSLECFKTSSNQYYLEEIKVYLDMNFKPFPSNFPLTSTCPFNVFIYINFQ